MSPPLGSLAGSEDKSLKDKISYAIRQVEVQRREVEQLRLRIEERRKNIFDAIVRAYEEKDDLRGDVLSNEHVEMQKVTRVVNASELALLHIIVRMETLRDVGDVMYALTNAFKEVKKIGKSIQTIAPNLENAANEINESFSSVLSELGILTPSISIALTDTPEEIFQKAEQLILEKTSELGELPKSIEQMQSEGGSILERTKRIALLASGDSAEDGNGNANDEEEFRPAILVAERHSRADSEEAVRSYMREKGTDKIDVLDCSASLNLPVDLVEQACIKLLSERRMSASSRSN